MDPRSEHGGERGSSHALVAGGYLEIAAVSFAALCLEVSYTRIFSFKLYYYFTYLIIGIALLGLGTGGVLVGIAPRWRARAARLIPLSCLAGSAAAAISYLVVARVEIAAFALGDDLVDLGKLALVCAALFAPFLTCGIVVALILAARPARVARLYGADLVGAGLACALWVQLAAVLTPPGCVYLASLVLAGAAVPLLRRHARAWLPVATALACAAGVVLAAPGLLPDPVPDPEKPLNPRHARYMPVLSSHWSPLFRVDVMERPYPFYGTSYTILHDGLIGSILHRFDGDLGTLSRFDADSRSLPFAVLPPDPSVLIIGAAGGHEILASLYFGAGHITAVELNSATTSLLTGEFADYTGRIAEHERVTLVTAEGRSFLTGQQARYDLVWLVAPDSYAAMNAATAGAYVLSESYLYTVEMVEEALAHLTDTGLLCAQFGEIAFERKPNRTARYLATAREAFRRLGIDDFAGHVAVVTQREFLTQSTILLRRTPFTDADIARIDAAAGRVPNAVVRHVPGRTADDGAVGQMIDLPQEALPGWHRAHAYSIEPVTDDSPFFWHFTRFRDVLRPPAVDFDWEEQTGERVLLTLLVFAAAFAGVWMLVPVLATRAAWRGMPHKARAAVYFAAVGTGFMFFEITMIQRLVLLLGYPTYSLTVTLFALLVFTGCGSLASERYLRQRNRSLLILIAILVTVTLAYQLGLPVLVHHFAGAPVPVRVVLAVAALAPLGLCLGAFMPLGLATVAAVSPHSAEYIAWGWAVNGFFSVVSAILSTVLAMVLGFSMLLWCALVLYGLGICALWPVPAPRADAAPRSGLAAAPQPARMAP